MTFKLIAKDSNGKNTSEGGDYVTATVTPGTSAAAAGAKEIAVEIKDNENGTYNGTYEVPARGDYKLTVLLNGEPVGGSPFPLFFSPPDPNAVAAAKKSMAAAAVAAELAAKEAAQAQEPAKPAGPSLPPPPLESSGPAAHAAGVLFPDDEELQVRTLLASNLPPSVKADQLKALFRFIGTVSSVEQVGINNDFALIQFERTQAVA